MDAFKYSDIDDWRTAWKTKIEPNLAEYEVMRTNKLALVKTQAKTALYDNFFSTRFLPIFQLIGAKIKY